MIPSLLINGNIVSGEAEKTILSSPENNEFIAEVPCASIVQVDAAVDAANMAFPGGKRNLLLTGRTYYSDSPIELRKKAIY